MATHTAIRIAAICMLALITSPSLAQECFQIRLPEGHKEIRVPANLALVRYQGQSALTPAGFWLYHEGENLSLSGLGHFCLAQDIVRNVGIAKLLDEPDGSGPLIQLSYGDLTFILIDLFSSAWQFAVATEVSTCKIAIDNSGDDWTISISNSGSYCIGQDLRQSDPFYRLPHQAVPKEPLLVIQRSHVLADLNQHRLITSVLSRAGVRVLALKQSPINGITVRNGFISSSSGPTVFMVDAFDDGKDARFGQHLAIAAPNGNTSRYRPTEFVLENLTLEGNSHAIVMQGMNNIIRHCKISGGNGTVNIFGPNLIFEDNEVILHARAQAETNDQAPVALYLEDSANSVVRNNRITIKGNTSDSKAIVLKNSPNVTLQGNTISGTDALYKRLDEQSSVIATDNHLNR